ncbi:MAG: 3-hydroxyacyl-CoA dehydrogenase NAD-binding domain-containing protein [Alphaproteobacteria bacterium]
MNLANFKWDQDADGIVTLTWDMPGRTMNVVSSAAITELGQDVEKIASDASVKGVILTSGKDNAFCAGADLDEMAAVAGHESPENARAILAMMNKWHAIFRRLETCGKPVVATINGLALGGGFEVTLACHYRLVADNPKIQLGLPEARLGLLPGGGGTQRLPRLIGAQSALLLMTEGKRVSPQEALGLRLVHKLAPAASLIAEAKKWLKESPNAVQPWDRPDFRIPGGGPYSTGGSQGFTVGNAMLRKQTYDNYPAQAYIMSCVYEGLLLDIDNALKVEARYFTRLLMQPSARNMVRTLFISMQELGKGARRPESEAPATVKTLGVLGAGLMGSGIAYVSARAGMDVVLLDTTMERANAGKDHAAKLMDYEVGRGRATPEKKAEVLARIKPVTDFVALKDADLVIEAVFEDRAIKADVTKKTGAVTKPACIFGSNTSTLPITGLAEASARPENFIGIHFFSPVEKMALVEIIVGKKTSPRALATAIDYVRQIKKTPIVVNDARGFYTSRVFMTYVNEGLEMIGERVSPALIENAGRMSGMPMGPLEVTDSVGVETALKIMSATRKEVLHQDKSLPAEEFLSWVVEKNGRPGSKAKKGFYDYDERGKRVRLWPELFSYGGGKWQKDFGPREILPFTDELKLRFLTVQALEAARALEEGVVTDPRDADVGAILGWGFAPFTGGPLSYIDTVGAATFVSRCESLAKKYGPRFRPNKLLREMAAKGDTFYARFAPEKSAA